MKKFSLSLIALVAIMATFTLTSCKKDSVVGSWKANLSEVLSDSSYKNVKGDWIINLKDDNTCEMKMKGSITANENGAEFSMDLDATLSGTYEYKDKTITSDFSKGCTVNVTNLQVSDEMQEAMDEQGITVDALSAKMTEAMKATWTSSIAKATDEVVSVSDKELVVKEDGKQLTFTKQ